MIGLIKSEWPVAGQERISEISRDREKEEEECRILPADSEQDMPY